ncbi:MAG: penicillin acylase family protein [Nitrospira sp.]|jgi:acyl-homoserine-lactone acylase|nr:penicillin acylase family protein [Nitrospira sp.]
MDETIRQDCSRKAHYSFSVLIGRLGQMSLFSSIIKQIIRPSIGVVLLGIVFIVMTQFPSGDSFLAWWFQDTVDSESGEVTLRGIRDEVIIRRDALGIPVIEAHNREDLAFAMGFVMAHDRLEQMVGFTLTAQGRLAEMAGPVALDLDVYLRTLGLRRVSEQQYAQLSESTKHFLQQFSNGVNSYLDTHRDRLPAGFRMSRYEPEPWTPLNSVDLLTLVNLSLSLNLHEEISILNIVKKVGWEKAAWLVPVYPDAPLPFDEAAKLKNTHLASIALNLDDLTRVSRKVDQAVLSLGIAASNNWAIAKERTRAGASILANDIHLMLSQPPMWMLMHVKSPGYDVAGIALAGLPAILFGFNGHVAWGASMVMADTQDLYLEELKQIDGKIHYRYQEKWFLVDEHTEIFNVLGKGPIKRTVRATRHGPLITEAIEAPQMNPIMSPRLDSVADPKYGLALRWGATEPDDSLDVIFDMGKSVTFQEASVHAQNIHFIHLNLVFADKDNIGWQVTGRYPKRKAGKGLFPSPGWTNDYDWEGFSPLSLNPRKFNPMEGFITTANNRTIPEGYPLELTNSWFYPERAERITELIQENDKHTAETSFAMQGDQLDRFFQKLKDVLLKNREKLSHSIERLPLRDREDAQRALAMLIAFDGTMSSDSCEGTIYGTFQHFITQETFLDELGPVNAPAYLALVKMSVLSYSAQQDHMLQREDSPFWDDITTPVATETKWDIFARALSRSWQFGTQQLGADSTQWRWGKLHTYRWESQATQLKPYLGKVQQFAIGILSGFLDRGPYPAGGNHNTLNQASYAIGEDFKVWIVPASRMVVDFTRDEPMWVMNSGGQSGNPASSHYADGIQPWLSSENRPMPFRSQNIETQYTNMLRLTSTSH